MCCGSAAPSEFHSLGASECETRPHSQGVDAARAAGCIGGQCDGGFTGAHQTAVAPSVPPLCALCNRLCRLCHTRPGGSGRGALEGKGPQRRPQRRLDRRLEEGAKGVGGGYCRLQMSLRPALGVRKTVAGHRVGALAGEGGVSPPPPMHPWVPDPPLRMQSSPCPAHCPYQ